MPQMRVRSALVFLLAACALAGIAAPFAACGGGEEEVDLSLVFDELLGGETTAFSAGSNAFELSARNLNNEERRVFEVGDSFFNQNWVTAPASTEARDGLGPVFNAQSCSSCHSHDGRARPPENDEDPVRGLLLRLSVMTPGGPHDEPVYGDQLQDRAIIGVPAEGRIGIRYETVEGEYPDGTAFTLRKPSYEVLDPAFGPLDPGVMISPRIAPVTFGTGLLEAIPEEDILARSDPEDADRDGISGRPNMVLDVATGTNVLGRFGWKANQPTVEQQSAGAFLGDIGITSSYFPEENCVDTQTLCREAPNGGDPEVPDERLAKVTFYLQTLAVPAMRDVDEPEVQQGARLFVTTGCSSCHTPRHETPEDYPIRALADQVFFPFTDLLLHDMGKGLADNRPDGLATGSEWRTPPLWGIGLVEVVNGHTTFLHDGRARNLEEAILWHGGEAEQARDNFMGLSSDEREALIRFLRSL